MAIGSGLGGSFGIAPEVTYGTYVAPTRFFEVDKSEVKKAKTIVQGGGLAAGRMVQAGGRRVMVAESGTGSVDLDVTNKTMGLLLQNIFGGAGTIAQQAATAAWLQTHALADNVGRSLTAQNGIPDTTGTVRPYTGKGGKVTSAEFKCSTTELLKLSLELDFQKVSEIETLAAPSYIAAAPFHGGQMRVKLGTFGAEAAVDGVKGFSLKIERPQDTERNYASTVNPVVKAAPIMNDWAKVSGSLDVDFVNKADFADRFASDASTSLVIEFVGPLIASTYYETFSLQVPMTFFDGDTPTLDGPGVVKGSVPFVGQFDLTNAPVICKYISADTAI